MTKSFHPFKKGLPSSVILLLQKQPSKKLSEMGRGRPPLRKAERKDPPKHVLSFGKFKGTKVAQAPKKYILWLAAQEEDLTEAQKWVRKHHLTISEEARRILESYFRGEFAFHASM